MARKSVFCPPARRADRSPAARCHAPPPRRPREKIAASRGSSSAEISAASQVQNAPSRLCGASAVGQAVRILRGMERAAAHPAAFPTDNGKFPPSPRGRKRRRRSASHPDRPSRVGPGHRAFSHNAAHASSGPPNSGGSRRRDDRACRRRPSPRSVRSLISQAISPSSLSLPKRSLSCIKVRTITGRGNFGAPPKPPHSGSNIESQRSRKSPNTFPSGTPRSLTVSAPLSADAPSPAPRWPPSSPGRPATSARVRGTPA